MMLCKLSINNLKKSFKDYAIYFSTLIIGVSIFYIFNSIESQTAMMKMTSTTHYLIDLVMELIGGLSVFVSFILGFLIIYASRFLIKKRNKEFSIYMILGMSKKKISLMIILETFLIGVISLIIGLFVGVLLSQVTSVFIIKLFDGMMEKYVFVFSMEALIKTIIYFSIIYFVVILFNTFIINKIKLINLINASRKGERVIVKDKYVCFIMFILSVSILGSAYYMVTGGIDIIFSHEIGFILIPIFMGIIGTVLFFYSISSILTMIFKKFKNVYYRGLNSFIFKELNSKVNTMVISMSFICIMLFVTFCLLSACMSIKDYYINSINTFSKVDANYVYKVGYRYVDGEYTRDSVESDEGLIKNVINDDVKDYISEYELVTLYEDDDFDFKASLGERYDFYHKKYPNVNVEYLVEVMKLSDYKKLSRIMGFDDINLNSGEYCILSNYQSDIYDDVMNSNSSIVINGNKLVPNSNKTVNGYIFISSNANNSAVFIVNDDVILDNNIFSKIIYMNYNELGHDNSEELLNKLRNIDYDFSYVNSKSDIKEDSVTVSVVVTFIGLYLGIVLLISSAAILSLKELSEAIDNKNKYNVLRRIGVSESDINKCLFKQILVFFLMPLILGIVHTFFGIKFSTIILNSIGLDSLSIGIYTTLFFLVFIYGLYFIITYISSKNIIKSN